MISGYPIARTAERSSLREDGGPSTINCPRGTMEVPHVSTGCLANSALSKLRISTINLAPRYCLLVRNFSNSKTFCSGSASNNPVTKESWNE